MAEGWARSLAGDVIDACSAGTSPHGLNPLAVRAMAEAGVDISHHRSKSVDEFRDADLDVVVTVCDSAHESCPAYFGGRSPDGAKTQVLHAGFDDPPRLARGAASDDEAMAHYRRVRDEIRAFIEGLPAALGIHRGLPETNRS